MKKEYLKGKLIISCQAVDDEPLNDAFIVSKLAFACVKGGAQILRMSQYDHIKSAKSLVNVPIIGLIKERYENSEVFITPTIKEVQKLIDLEVDVIAVDSTMRTRPDGKKINEFFSEIKNKFPNQLLMADCTNVEDVINASELGFDFIGTTLRGYTKETEGKTNIENDFEFLKQIVTLTDIPIILEGGIWNVEDAKKAIQNGAYAVVVGSAITRPHLIVERWLKGFE